MTRLQAIKALIDLGGEHQGQWEFIFPRDDARSAAVLLAEAGWPLERCEVVVQKDVDVPIWSLIALI